MARRISAVLTKPKKKQKSGSSKWKFSSIAKVELLWPSLLADGATFLPGVTAFTCSDFCAEIGARAQVAAPSGALLQWQR